MFLFPDSASKILHKILHFHCLVIAQSDLPGYYENWARVSEMLLHSSGISRVATLVLFAHWTAVTNEEANHMLENLALVLVVSFSRNRNHGVSRTESVSCQLSARF